MDVREKLVELLSQYFDIGDSYAYNLTRVKSAFACGTMDFDDFEEFGEKTVTDIAEYLISHGVTVQEWISVTDKLPPYNRNVLVYRPNMAMKILVDTYDGYYGDDDDEWYEGWALYGGDTHGNPVITHWAYLPQPPKGE